MSRVSSLRGQIASKLHVLTLARSRRDWSLAGVIVAAFVGVLASASLATPYKEPPLQVFYENESAQEDTTYLRAHITKRSGDTATVRLLDGPRVGQTVTLMINPAIAPEVGEKILVREAPGSDAPLHYLTRWRVPGLLVMAAVFVALVVLVGGRRGAMSLLGLVASLMVIGWGIIPLIAAGWPAFWVCLAGALAIALVSVLISHGFHRRTYVSIGIIVAILLVVAALSWAAITLFGLTGITDESTLYLSMAETSIDLRGVLAGGMIIATLGVLDDVVTTQVAAVDELQKAQPDASATRIAAQANSIGREHISSLVNTLALAYTGASLPFILLLVLRSGGVPPLVIVSGEYLSVEIARTLVASIGLLIAVPASTYAAVYIFRRLLK